MAIDAPSVVIVQVPLQRRVEGVRFPAARGEDRVELLADASGRPLLLRVSGAPKPRAHHLGRSRREHEAAMRGGLGPVVLPALRVTVHDLVMDRILPRQRVRGVARALAEDPPSVGLVRAEMDDGRVLEEELPRAEIPMVGAHAAGFDEIEVGLGRTEHPRPGVAEEHRGEDVHGRLLRPAVGHGDAPSDVLGGRLGVLDDDVEVAVLLEDAGVDQLELGFALGATRRLLDELLVGVRRVRVEIAHPQVGVGRRRVEVVVDLFDVLPMVALLSGQAEQALLEDRIALVPERDREAETLLGVAEATEAVLSPAISAAARVGVREVIPRRAVAAVALAHGPPLPLAEVGPPRAVRCALLAKSLPLGIEHLAREARGLDAVR